MTLSKRCSWYHQQGGVLDDYPYHVRKGHLQYLQKLLADDAADLLAEDKDVMDQVFHVEEQIEANLQRMTLFRVSLAFVIRCCSQ